MGSVRRVVVAVTGGIAAYKVPLLVRLLRKNGCEVKVVMTEAARPLVGVEALRTLSGNPVYTDSAGGAPPQHDMGHIRLSEWADLLLVCPATANTIAKMACGIADNLLTTLALSVPEKKIIIAPAMNCVMWANAATQSNVEALRGRGVNVLPVEDGELACGVSGPGRMLGIDKIASFVMSFPCGEPLCSAGMPVDGGLPAGKSLPVDKSPAVTPDSLKGKTVLISSGPTEEPIDPVRVITNRSSGKMGAALAGAALSAGARVVVVSGPASEPLPFGAEVISVRTASDMEAELVKRFVGADICIMAAAVSDYRPSAPSSTKLHRSESERLVLELVPNPDIAAKLGASKSSGQFLAGFSLESGDSDIVMAEEKMQRKNCDMMIFNKADVSLGGESTGFTILFKDGRKEVFPVTRKVDAARIIINNIAGCIN
ncbi:MAG: bifunctional phosphopantothenoylcysteine decarboxylase/phosphopantothenate synthase [Chitinispirillia bacterium]|nr:bifunctional phosphopantothenoylcysteine decarboxylase/phosphopantothenate synthase [Chitinispirillia bacterium]MCL2267999.1 bifunctional phosphopantothenoylcysteine decarboxylase/phosphopantothenate synthase [Chitinispirillia bacterium]